MRIVPSEWRRLALIACALAVPAWLLTTWSFTPLEHRASLSGRDAIWTFALGRPEWLFIESDLAVQAEGEQRPTVILIVNGVEVTRYRPTALYVGERARTLIPVDRLRAGDNQLRLYIETSSSATFRMNFRLQNYRGINPRFPRVVVVADEAVASQHASRGSIFRAVDFAALGLTVAALVWLLDRTFRHWPASGAALIVGPSVAVLWAAVVYSITSPLHVWLFPEALATLMLGPALLTGLVVIATRHWRPLLRIAMMLAVTIALCEAGLRALNRFAPTPIFYSESYGRYRGRPGAPFLDTYLNSAGFNDVERTRDRRSDVRRIVAIGDSVTFGVVPRQHNFVTLLEKELAAERPTEVINMGVPGAAPNDYLAILVEEGLGYQPDLVLVGFFIGNDFEARARRWYERSYAATFGYFLWRLSTSAGEGATWVESTSGTYDDAAPTFGADRFLEIEVSRADIYVNEEQLLTATDRVAAYLAEMRDITRRAGADFVVVIIPDELQVNVALQQQVMQAHRSGAEGFDFTRPNRALSDSLAGRGITHFDLTPAFQSAAQERRLYKPQDTHWNVAGNRLAATLLSEYLANRAQ